MNWKSGHSVELTSHKMWWIIMKLLRRFIDVCWCTLSPMWRTGEYCSGDLSLSDRHALKLYKNNKNYVQCSQKAHDTGWTSITLISERAEMLSTDVFQKGEQRVNMLTVQHGNLRCPCHWNEFNSSIGSQLLMHKLAVHQTIIYTI